MENSGASNSGPNGQPLGYDASMDVDQLSNSVPNETRIEPDSSMRFDQASSCIPDGQPLVQPDPSIGFTGLDQAINLIPNGPYLGPNPSTGFDQAGNPIPNGAYLGEDPSMNFDPSLDPSFDFNTDFDFNMDLSNTDFSNLDFSNIDFSNLDCSTMITPPLSPPLDPSNVTFSNEPFIFNPLAAPATTEQEIISLHAQLPREYHVLAKAVDEGLHNILALLDSALATPDKAPTSKSTEPTNPTTNSTTTDTASCLSHLPPLMHACHALQADGEKLCLADPGGYGVLCRTFQQVAYRFDLHRTSPELVFEDWFEVFVGMRERIGRMGRDGLFAVARGAGARRLGGGGGEGKGKVPEETTSAKSGKSSGGGKGAVAKGEGKVKAEVKGEKKAGKGETAKWERDGDGRLIKR